MPTIVPWEYRLHPVVVDMQAIMSQGQGLPMTEWQLTKLTMQALNELSQAVGVKKGVAVISYGSTDQAKEVKQKFEERLARVNVYLHTIHARQHSLSAIRAEPEFPDGLEEQLRFCLLRETRIFFSTTQVNCQDIDIQSLHTTVLPSTCLASCARSLETEINLITSMPY